MDQAIMDLIKNISDDKKDEDKDTPYGKKTVGLHLVEIYILLKKFNLVTLVPVRTSQHLIWIHNLRIWMLLFSMIILTFFKA